MVLLPNLRSIADMLSFSNPKEHIQHQKPSIQEPINIFLYLKYSRDNSRCNLHLMRVKYNDLRLEYKLFSHSKPIYESILSRFDCPNSIKHIQHQILFVQELVSIFPDSLHNLCNK